MSCEFGSIMCGNRLWRYLTQPRSAVGLAMFRIVYSLTLLAEVVQLYSIRHLVFDTPASLLGSHVLAGPLFGLWMVCILCLVVGLFTRTAAVVNYVMTLATFSTFSHWEYHVDYIYTGMNCFLLLVPVSRVMSVDAWLERRRCARLGMPSPATTVPRVHYDALILVGISLVYFDSVYYKLASPMWTSGLGVWRPASLPHNTYWDVGRLLDVKPLMLTLGYLTLAFECLFLLLMWFDRLRPWLFLVGVGLHLGIVVMFPIPWFGFAVLALYLLLVPDRYWQWIASGGFKTSWGKLPACQLRNFSGPKLAASATTLGSETSSTPVFGKRHSRVSSSYAQEPDSQMTSRGGRAGPVTAGGVFALAMIVCASQLVMTATAPLSRQIAAQIGGESLRSDIERLAIHIHPLTRKLFGVTPHPVFMDFHFDGYESFFTLVHVDDAGRQTWLPMAAGSGQARLGWSGRLWVNWTWRVSNPQPDPAMLRDGFHRVTAWWLARRGRPLDDAQFVIMRRDCDPCDGWSEGYYQRQLQHAWRPVGVAEWRDGTFDARFECDAYDAGFQSRS